MRFQKIFFGTVPMFLWLYFAIDYWSIYRICHRTISAKKKKKKLYTVYINGNHGEDCLFPLLGRDIFKYC